MRTFDFFISAFAAILIGASAQAESTDVSNKIYLIASVQAPAGTVTLPGPGSDFVFTALVFKNTGSSPVVISHVQIQSSGGELSATDGNMGLGVGPGRTVVLLFSNHNPVSIEQINFSVEGSTESLQVYGLNRSGIIPGGFSAGN